MFNKKEIDENKNQVIEDFEKLREENPEVFRFLLKEYASDVFSSMPWSELWADEPFTESMWSKFMPFFTPILVIFCTVITILMLK